MQINYGCCPGSQIISQTTTISNLRCIEKSVGNKGLKKEGRLAWGYENGVGYGNASAGADAPVLLKLNV